MDQLRPLKASEFASSQTPNLNYALTYVAEKKLVDARVLTGKQFKEGGASRMVIREAPAFTISEEIPSPQVQHILHCGRSPG